MIDTAVQALIAELHRQGIDRGVTVEDNGRLAQVDGSFPVRPLVRAVLKAIREPGDEVLHQLFRLSDPDATTTEAQAWAAAIDTLLDERERQRP
jgi:hypothetical protein